MPSRDEPAVTAWLGKHEPIVKIARAAHYETVKRRPARALHEIKKAAPARGLLWSSDSDR
jgi:hypothetical protein